MLSKAVFLDKDGTLVQDIPYNVDPERIRLLEGVPEGLRQLQDEGYQLIVVTNQSGVARGYFEEHALEQVENRIQELLASTGVQLAGFYYCPHHPNGKIPQYATECNCRKPKPGLIQKAVLKYMIDLTDSWLVGDILNDIEAGNRAGCRTILIDNGNETEWKISPLRQPAFVAQSLYEASSFIIRESHVERNVS